MKTEVRTDLAPKPVGPYSQAIKLTRETEQAPPSRPSDDVARLGGSGLVFASGQLPINPETGQLLKAGIEDETRQAFANLARVLEAAGTSLDRVLKVTIFLTDLADFGRVNEVYSTQFNKPFPARSCFQVAALPVGARIEVEAIAEC